MNHFSTWISPFFIGLLFFVSGCGNSPVVNEGTIEGITFREISTNLTADEVNDIGMNSALEKETKQLKKAGIVQEHTPDLQSSTEMIHLQAAYGPETTERTPLLGVKAFKGTLPKTYTIGECDESDWCLVTKPEFSPTLADEQNSHIFFGSEEDIYLVGIPDEFQSGTYTLYQGQNPLFGDLMTYGADGPIREAKMVLGKPAFSYQRLSGTSEESWQDARLNLWYDGVFFNDAYNLTGSSHPFSYEGKLGFVAEIDNKAFMMFDGKRISEDYDEIRTLGCCAIFPFPIFVDTSGILFFLAKKGEEYVFVEIDLNQVKQE